MPELPNISIIVPNFNGAKTLAAALQSLVDQRYPSLQILVVDGGSTDGSVEIIRKFETHIAWWTSEKDRGQSDAINKGFAKATGEVINWLCSDDRLEPGAVLAVGKTFAEDPSVDVVMGACRQIVCDGPGNPVRDVVGHPTQSTLDDFPMHNNAPQSSCFFRKRLLEVGRPPLDETLHYTMDFDLWCRFVGRGAKWKIIPDVLSTAVQDGQNKMSTGGAKISEEIERVYRRYAPRERIPLSFWYRRFGYPMDRWRARHPGVIAGLLVKIGKFIFMLAMSPFYGGIGRVRRMNWSMYV